jgi:hypothetical protein
MPTPLIKSQVTATKKRFTGPWARVIERELTDPVADFGERVMALDQRRRIKGMESLHAPPSCRAR